MDHEAELTAPCLLCFRYQGGDRALGICLSVIKNSVLKRNAGMRSKSKKVVFVVSSGKSWNGVFPQFPANWMKKHDVEIFGLTIGQEKNALEQLQGIATEPVEKHVFWVKKLKEIPNLLTLLNGKGKRW